MADYEQSKAINAPAEEVFAWLTDVGNLSGYLPPVTDASIEGPSAEGSPGQKVRMALEFPNGSSFESEGYLATEERERRMEWGAETNRDYSGWLTVANHGEGGRRSWCTSPSASVLSRTTSRAAPPKTATPYTKRWARRSSPSGVRSKKAPARCSLRRRPRAPSRPRIKHEVDSPHEPRSLDSSGARATIGERPRAVHL